MKFYFCETCGKRVTDMDMESGQARNKKLKGVFCAECAVGVLTMETMPLTEEQARKLLGKSATPPAGTSFSPGSAGAKANREFGSNASLNSRKDGARSGNAASDDLSPRPSKAHSIIIGIAAGLVASLVLGIGLLGRGEPPKPKTELTTTEQNHGKAAPKLDGPDEKTRPHSDTRLSQAIPGPGSDPGAEKTDPIAKSNDGPQAAPVVEPPERTDLPAQEGPAPDKETPSVVVPAAALESLPLASSPPILTEDQRTVLRFYDDVFSKLRSQQFDAACLAVKNTKIAEAKPLESLLDRAGELNKKVQENLNKKPPSTPINFKLKGEELSGQLKRIDGASAWVVSKGLEVRLGIEELPVELFLEALAVDQTNPEGQYDLVAFHLAGGRMETAIAHSKRLDPAKNSDLLDMLEHCRSLQRLGLFADAVAAVEDAIKEGKSQDATRLLSGIKKSFAELVSGEQKTRIEQLEARADGSRLVSRVKSVLSGEVLELRDDLYIEIRYDFTKPGVSRDDFSGTTWSLTPAGLSYTPRGGVEGDLSYKASFQTKQLHFEVVQSAADHDVTIGVLGKSTTEVHFSGNGPALVKYANVEVANHKTWKHPLGNGTFRFTFERDETEAVFKLDQTECFRDKLPPQISEEKVCTVKLRPSRPILLKEAVLKGYLDKDWLLDALKTRVISADGLLPGLWASYYSGDGNSVYKHHHFSKADFKLTADFGQNAPDSRLPRFYYGIKYLGVLKIETEGEYEFNLLGDDYVGLTIADKLVSEASAAANRKYKPSRVKLVFSKGYYPIRISYAEAMGVGKFHVKWRLPGATTFSDIPATALWHSTQEEKE